MMKKKKRKRKKKKKEERGRERNGEKEALLQEEVQLNKNDKVRAL